MPGSFTFENTLPPKVDISAGAKSHIFQPPPHSASSSLHGSNTWLASSWQDSGDAPNAKRTRHEVSSTDHATPYSSAPLQVWSSMSHDPASSSTLSGMESPPSLANAQYRLAGGLDTPIAEAASATTEGRSPHDEARRMPGRRGIRDFDTMESHHCFSSTPSTLAQERNGQARLPKSPNLRDSLGNVIYRFAGVAGKILENWTTAFRGFYAGGGLGYAITAPTWTGFGNPLQEVGQDKQWSTDGGDGTLPPTPGGFPLEDYIPEYMLQDHSTTSRAAKRHKRETATGDVTASWVMVSSTTSCSSRETSPSRLSQRKLPRSNGGTNYSSSKFGLRPNFPASRPSLSPFAGSPGLRSCRPSIASPRSPTAASPKRGSPVSLEVQRHAARLRKKEAAEDASLKRFNQQLKAMIREGREALGTTFEVNDGGVDERFLEKSDVFVEGVGAIECFRAGSSPHRELEHSYA